MRVVILLLCACNGKDDAPVVPSDGGDDDAPVEDTSPTVPVITTRPANPTCLAPARPPSASDIALTRIFPTLEIYRATLAVQPPGDPNSWWVARQDGKILRFDATVAEPATDIVLDIDDRVDATANEGGLLSFAFDPGFATNGEVIVSYTAGSPFRTVLSRFRSTDGGTTIDPGTEEVLFTLDQPFSNHNGGNVLFGRDGYLYLGLGDGGSGGDPYENGQNVNVLFGKMLRIDVHAAGVPYGIPPDNPFANGGGRPEIYAWGLRNPWRFSIDPANGDLWVGDVGQDKLEEIDLVRRGGNYGWNVMEADTCYAATDCDKTGKVLPVAVTSHADGDASVTGGVVYRGSAMPELQGTYLWGDYGSGRIYGWVLDPVTGEREIRTLLTTTLGLTHIGVDATGEIVLVDRYEGLYRIGPAGEPPTVVTPFPETLSATGCFDPADPNQPGSMLIPYRVAHPFWSDGAEKDRWFAIPDGTIIEADPQGDLVLPNGSVVVKTFTVQGRKTETRLLVRHDDGVWAGYSYEWNADGTDADLRRAGVEVAGGEGQPWSIPSLQQCLQCHTRPTGGSLGLSLQQLGVEDQIEQLVDLELLTAPTTTPAPYPSADDPAASVEAKARAYLDVNCSFCHFEGGTGGGDLDLRQGTALADSAMCDEPREGDLGVASARVVTPGDPSRSILSLRIRSRDIHGMPPVGSLKVDDAGADLIDAWIAGLATCP